MGGEYASEQGESGEIGFDVSDDLAPKRMGGLEGVRQRARGRKGGTEGGKEREYIHRDIDR